jgi:hypothetical protein
VPDVRLGIVQPGDHGPAPEVRHLGEAADVGLDAGAVADMDEPIVQPGLAFSRPC